MAGYGIPLSAPYFVPFGVGWLEAALLPGLASILPAQIYADIGTRLNIHTPATPDAAASIKIGTLQISWVRFSFSFSGGLPQSKMVSWDTPFLCVGAICSCNVPLITSVVADGTSASINVLVPSGISPPVSASGFVVGFGVAL